MSDPLEMFNTDPVIDYSFKGANTDMLSVPSGYQAPMQAGFQPPSTEPASLMDAFKMFLQGNQQQSQTPDLTNLQDSWFTGNYVRNDLGEIQADAMGNPLMEGGLTGLDMAKLGMAGLQGFMGWKGRRDNLKLGRDKLNLQRQAYSDSRADAKRLRDAARSYAQSQQG